MVDIAEAATRKIGPLPAWAWGGVVGVGLLVYRATSGGSDGASSPFVQPVSGGEPFDFGAGGGSGGASGSGSNPATPTVTTGIPTDIPNLAKYVMALRDQYPQTAANYRQYFGGAVSGETDAQRIDRLTKEINFYREYGQDEVPTIIVPTMPTPTTSLAPVSSGTRPAIERTGDTSAMEPPTLGLPLDRVEAIVRTQIKAAASYREPGPTTPRIHRDIPGVAPTLPPILRTQGDTRNIGDTRTVVNPRNLAMAMRTRVRGSLPTTTAHPFRVPTSLTAAAQRIRPTRAG